MTTLGTINTIAPGVRIHRWIVLGPAEPSVILDLNSVIPAAHFPLGDGHDRA
jgi:hypothetical protein